MGKEYGIAEAIKDLQENYGIAGSQYDDCETWEDLSYLNSPLPEEFIEKYSEEVDWKGISIYQHLSESFIEKHADDVNWYDISSYQWLSESFIDKYSDKIKWEFAVIHQKLSEKLIEKYLGYINWYKASTYQQLSEKFIDKYSDIVDWVQISSWQKLTEDFIESHADKVNWICVSIYQQLSENFIRKHKNELALDDIARHQVISLNFAKELGIADIFLKHNNCLKPVSYWKEAVENTELYECHEDYFIAYKGLRFNRYGRKIFLYQYLPGKPCECFSDYSDDKHSFGLSAGIKETAENYCDKLVVRVKVYYEDVTAVNDNGEIRCKKMTALE